MRVLLLLFFLSVKLLDAQTDSLAFPQSWEGKYTGTLEIFTAVGKTQSLPMELHILPIDTSDNHTFYIIYGEDKVAGLRPYELVTIDAAKGLYKIDEKNGIAMEGYLLGNSFVQRFEVMGNLLTMVTEKTGADELTWTVYAGKAEAVSVSGGETEEVPVVAAFGVGSVQRGVLGRRE